MGIKYLNLSSLDNFDNKGRKVCCKVSLCKNWWLCITKSQDEELQFDKVDSSCKFFLDLVAEKLIAVTSMAWRTVVTRGLHWDYTGATLRRSPRLFSELLPR